jgi:hypothetical protein
LENTVFSLDIKNVFRVTLPKARDKKTASIFVVLTSAKSEGW